MEERFDVLNPDGTPAGYSCPRSEVHARGLWHRAFHLFLVARLSTVDGRRRLPHAILQLRSHDKDTSAGKLDVAVGGHYAAGETLSDVVREVDEEIGLFVRPEDLTFLWTQPSEHETQRYVDREHQDVYLLRRDRPPSEYKPDPVELAGLCAVPLDALAELLEGRSEAVDATGVFRMVVGKSARFVPGTRSFSAADFIPGDHEHLLRAVRAARASFSS